MSNENPNNTVLGTLLGTLGTTMQQQQQVAQPAVQQQQVAQPQQQTTAQVQPPQQMASPTYAEVAGYEQPQQQQVAQPITVDVPQVDIAPVAPVVEPVAQPVQQPVTQSVQEQPVAQQQMQQQVSQPQANLPAAQQQQGGQVATFDRSSILGRLRQKTKEQQAKDMAASRPYLKVLVGNSEAIKTGAMPASALGCLYNSATNEILANPGETITVHVVHKYNEYRQVWPQAMQGTKGLIRATSILDDSDLAMKTAYGSDMKSEPLTNDLGQVMIDNNRQPLMLKNEKSVVWTFIYKGLVMQAVATQGSLTRMNALNKKINAVLMPYATELADGSKETPPYQTLVFTIGTILETSASTGQSWLTWDVKDVQYIPEDQIPEHVLMAAEEMINWQEAAMQYERRFGIQYMQ